MDTLIVIDAGDNVATLLADVAAGERVAGVATREAVPAGHKVALAGIAAGDAVVKYGAPIGRATRDIAPGEHVHSHNLATALGGTREYRWSPVGAVGADHTSTVRAELVEAPSFLPKKNGPSTSSGRTEGEGPSPTFRGYVRADGRVGTRNEIWVLPTVGCVARTAERIAREAGPLVAGLVDGVHAFQHPFGCSQLGDDLDATRRLLGALAQHPNAGGVVLVGLGCEENQLDALLADIAPDRRGSIRTVASQLAADEQADGVAAVLELARAAAAPRTEVGLDRLVLGVKCGGSDGLSGLTANPLVGRMTDRVTQAGGAAVLTEIPEIFGAEQLLMDRAADETVFGGIVEVVNGFKRYFLDHGQPVSENPSPGNVAGGITTLEEKSLGAVQKGGRATVTDVRRYGERVRTAGLTLLEAPGNDAVSSTALAAAGATCILFTTGRGTPLGFPVPTVKIASNSALAARKPGWIDFDAGVVLTQGFDAAEDALLARVLAVASGEETAAERNGEREIAIWKRGVTL